MRKKLGDLPISTIYAFIYGPEGVGKTALAMTLADDTGHGVGYITAESRGPTSLLTLGYPKDIAVEVLPPSGGDPFEPAIAAVRSFAADKAIRCIAVDGITVICGRAIDYESGGRGEKHLGYDGWGAVLNGFRKLEYACDLAVRAGKSVIMTAWEREPEYTGEGDYRMLTTEGRPLLQGQAKQWLPGNCDIVARMTSKFINKTTDGKTRKVFEAFLQTQRDGQWLAKTRWPLPNPCPANLKYVLKIVSDQARLGTSKPGNGVRHPASK